LSQRVRHFGYVGLAPIPVSHAIAAVNAMKQGCRLTVLMAEQNFNQAIRIADRGCVIDRARLHRLQGPIERQNQQQRFDQEVLSGVATPSWRTIIVKAVSDTFQVRRSWPP
jgi:hypothetical protein